MTQTSTAAQIAKIARIEDREGDGFCGACQRQGLRWIAVLSDGQQVGLECAKKVLGFRPAPIDYKWVADYQLVAEHTEGGATFGLYQHKTKNRTVATRNGSLTTDGGARADWTSRGWL